MQRDVKGMANKAETRNPAMFPTDANAAAVIVVATTPTAGPHGLVTQEL